MIELNFKLAILIIHKAYYYTVSRANFNMPIECKIMKFNKLFFGFGILVTSMPLTANDKPKWVDEGPYVTDVSLSLELPLEVIGNKLFVEVEIAGKPKRFLFDTGSPSMISSKLAKELKLKVIDKRQSKDSHGAIVDTNIVQSDLNIGGTTFYKTPIFTADFPKVPQCLFDGVLGSEILPLCAWQIDLPNSVLRCNSNLASLKQIKNAKKIPLYNFGYPHSPILDIQFSEKAVSKALFDTGSPDYITISPPDFEGAKRNDGIKAVTLGFGSLGGSIGGLAEQKKQHLVKLANFAVKDIPLGAVNATLRESSPSLIGTSILEHFVVTLDTKSSSAYFSEYKKGEYIRPSYGFSLSFDEQVLVSLVWDNSPAQKAGLSVGQHVTSINGKPTETSCEGIRDVMKAMESDSIQLEWKDDSKKITRAKFF